MPSHRRTILVVSALSSFALVLALWGSVTGQQSASGSDIGRSGRGAVEQWGFGRGNPRVAERCSGRHCATAQEGPQCPGRSCRMQRSSLSPHAWKAASSCSGWQQGTRAGCRGRGRRGSCRGEESGVRHGRGPGRGRWKAVGVSPRSRDMAPRGARFRASVSQRSGRGPDCGACPGRRMAGLHEGRETRTVDTGSGEGCGRGLCRGPRARQPRAAGNEG